MNVQTMKKEGTRFLPAFISLLFAPVLPIQFFSFHTFPFFFFFVFQIDICTQLPAKRLEWEGVFTR